MGDELNISKDADVSLNESLVSTSTSSVVVGGVVVVAFVVGGGVVVAVVVGVEPEADQ